MTVTEIPVGEAAMHNAPAARPSALTDTVGATVIIMAMTFGPGVAWLLGL